MADSKSAGFGKTASTAKPRPRLRFGRHSIPLPRSRTARIVTGGALLIGGSLWFLPVLGLWMLPAGVLVLSTELSWVRRMRRKAQLWWGRRKHMKKGPGG